MKQKDNISEYSDIMTITLLLCKRNPGAYSVISKIFEIIKNDDTKNDLIMDFIKELIIKNIVGERLWYIFKNEAKMDSNCLISLNLDEFTDEYFYEKFEKYTINN